MPKKKVKLKIKTKKPKTGSGKNTKKRLVKKTSGVSYKTTGAYQCVLCGFASKTPGAHCGLTMMKG